MSVRLQVRVRPKARFNKVEVSDLGDVRVSVTEAPEGGRANKAVIAAIARVLGVPKTNIALVRGRTSRDKVLEIAGVKSATEAVKRIRRQTD